MIAAALILGLVVAGSGPAFDEWRQKIARWRDFPWARVAWSTPAAIGADLAAGKDRAKITTDGPIPIRPRNT